MKSYIYGLVDPIENNVRYIGWTSQSLLERLKNHIKTSKRNNRTHKERWINKLIREGLLPKIVLIEEVSFEERWEKEKYWISKYGRDNLTNLTDGGDGPSGVKKSEELKEYFSKLFSGEGNPFYGKNHTPETIQKLKSRRLSPEQKEYLRNKRLGKTLSDETKKKIRESLLLNPPFKGRKHRPESIQKNKEKHIGIPSPFKGIKKNIPSPSRGKAKKGFDSIGVSCKDNKFITRVFYGDERVYLGSFDSKTSARIAYDIGKIYFYKNYDNLNFSENIDGYVRFLKDTKINSVEELRNQIKLFTEI